MQYTIRRTNSAPGINGDWGGPVWESAETLELSSFHPQGSDHKPRTQARLLCDDANLYVHFRVEDRYVRSVQVGFQKPVCSDSCVEFFVQPVEGKGYFNFEINCGGALLLHFNGPEGRDENKNIDSDNVAEDWLKRVRIYHSMPDTVDPEISEPTTWQVEYAVPFELFEAYAGPVNRSPGAQWRANLYKCGDKTSHPHWGSWAPIGERLDYHQPKQFQTLVFA